MSKFFYFNLVLKGENMIYLFLKVQTCWLPFSTHSCFIFYWDFVKIIWWILVKHSIQPSYILQMLTKGLCCNVSYHEAALGMQLRFDLIWHDCFNIYVNILVNISFAKGHVFRFWRVKGGFNSWAMMWVHGYNSSVWSTNTLSAFYSFWGKQILKTRNFICGTSDSYCGTTPNIHPHCHSTTHPST